jgi:hypothetical protein
VDVMNEIKGTPYVQEIADYFNAGRLVPADEIKLDSNIMEKKQKRYFVPWHIQFICLMKRHGREFMRNPSNAAVRLVVGLFIGLLYSTLFANLGNHCEVYK